MLELHNNSGAKTIGRAVRLPAGFRCGVGAMINGGGHWSNWRRYAYALTIKGDGWTAWQVRVLWFYVGRKRAKQ